MLVKVDLLSFEKEEAETQVLVDSRSDWQAVNAKLQPAKAAVLVVTVKETSVKMLPRQAGQGRFERLP
jgi:hypothetical protein